MPASSNTERTIFRVFEVGVILKGANAILEIIFGALLIFVNVGGVVQTLIATELVEDPNDFLIAHIAPLASGVSQGGETYAGLYLLSHGLVKIVLVVGLLRKKLWAYPASLAVLSLFAFYQGIKWLSTHSLALLLLTLFDLILIWLIYHEYRRVRASASW